MSKTRKGIEAVEHFTDWATAVNRSTSLIHGGSSSPQMAEHYTHQQLFKSYVDDVSISLNYLWSKGMEVSLWICVMTSLVLAQRKICRMSRNSNRTVIVL
jgi:hypothetical protein